MQGISTERRSLFERLSRTYYKRMGVPILRRYRSEDLEAMFALDEACFAPEFRFSRASMRQFAETRRARVVVAEDAGKLAGFCIVHVEKTPAGCAGYVVTLDVAPEYRRRGLGRDLLLHSEATVRGEGCGSMLLHVYVGNADAIRFYEGLGYRRGHTVEAFYAEGLDALVYRKQLNEA